MRQLQGLKDIRVFQHRFELPGFIGTEDQFAHLACFKVHLL